MARPRKIKSVEELQEKIDEYFASCEGDLLRDKDGNPVLNKHDEPVYTGKKMPTMTGLALSLGLSGRSALLNYKGRKGFLNAIERARARVEAAAEEALFTREGSQGARFTLACNFGWREKAEEDKATGVAVVLEAGPEEWNE